MTGLFIGLYGLYLVIVGVRGNAGALLDLLGQDAPKFIPWILAIVGIAVLSEFESTKPMVKPFIGLLVLNFALVNYETIETQVSQLYNLSNG